MRPRGMTLEILSPGCCRERKFFFNFQADFFAFYLTGAPIFCNHHRPPVVCTGEGRQKFCRAQTTDGTTVDAEH
jgi:hypothetical protein